jgi:hypothetical protein
MEASRSEEKSMKKWTIGIVVAAGVLALAGGVGIAAARASSSQNVQAGFYAASDNGSFYSQDVNEWYCGSRGMMGFITPQLATLLGTTQDELKTELASGKSLADLAGARNVSQDTLVQTLLGPYTDHLALMVKYGYLTQTQADTFAQQAKTRLQTAVTSTTRNGIGGMMRGWFGGGSGNGEVPAGQPASNGCGGGLRGGFSGGVGRGMMGGRW